MRSHERDDAENEEIVDHELIAWKALLLPVTLLQPPGVSDYEDRRYDRVCEDLDMRARTFAA
jgi:hypothetical protein